ncbi:MAG: hydroxymethylbilane synthase [Actinomycetota bacterium]|nr:hydroxymethylbilane synthase [Actinomycetota bacterium]
MKNELRLATRASSLAMVQTRRVADLLEAAHQGLQVTLVPVESSGDLDHQAPVAELTEVGAFVRSLQWAVLEGRADGAVHSCKDLPTGGPERLITPAYPERDSPFDVLVGGRLGELAPGARVGTGSPRRIAQLLALRSDLQPAELRGNVDTRLRKVAEGEVAAALLAEAGLLRLGRTSEIAQRFSLEEMVPAPAQGVLAVETLDGGEAAELVAAIDDPGVRRLVEAERRLLAETGAGCRSALGALAQELDGKIRMTTFVEDERGGRRAVVEGTDVEDVVEEARRELGL